LDDLKVGIIFSDHGFFGGPFDLKMNMAGCFGFQENCFPGENIQDFF